jgi:hypothetical protein
VYDTVLCTAAAKQCIGLPRVIFINVRPLHEESIAACIRAARARTTILSRDRPQPPDVMRAAPFSGVTLSFVA